MINSHEEKIKERIHSSQCVNFMLGTFFTIVICITAYKGSYYFLIALVPLVVTGIWKLWKNGEFKGDGVFGALYMVFISIPSLVYLTYDALKHRSGWFTIAVVLMVLLPIVYDLVVEFIKDIRGE